MMMYYIMIYIMYKTCVFAWLNCSYVYFPLIVMYRFANGFGADARRKRHTADSGYGSEQPLDRRWSQDFSQDVSS